jgi:hypothetical protein
MSQAGYEKKVKVADATESPTNFLDLTAVSATLNHGGDVLDDTDMANISATGMRSRILGLRDWSISATLNYDTSVAGVVTVLRNAWLNRTQLEMQYLPDGTVGNGFQGLCFVETFNMSGDVGGLEQVELSLVADGDLVAAT